jgi:hypothetical protein
LKPLCTAFSPVLPMFPLWDQLQQGNGNSCNTNLDNGISCNKTTYADTVDQYCTRN